MVLKSDMLALVIRRVVIDDVIPSIFVDVGIALVALGVLALWARAAAPRRYALVTTFSAAVRAGQLVKVVLPVGVIGTVIPTGPALGVLPH
jgi:hypothetical protein